MRGIARNLIILVVTLVIAWFVLGMLGFEMALGASLAISVMLTLVVYLVTSGARHARAQ